MVQKSRPGAVRKSKKGPSVGTGGHVRKSLEGRGPTPKAVDRSYHPASKAVALGEGKKVKKTGSAGFGKLRSEAGLDVVFGRNSVVEVLRARVPAVSLFVSTKIEVDVRVREVLRVATGRGIKIVEVLKTQLDDLTSGAVHQGLVLEIAAYEYFDVSEVMQRSLASYDAGGVIPLFVAVDGITDPRNLGAIVRSVAAFGGSGIVLPKRRSVGVTAGVWKTSVGALARVPVCQVVNLTRTVEMFKSKGFFVVALDAGGGVGLPDLSLVKEPLLVVIGSEGKGVSRLVGESCDQLVSIPIVSEVESLNAGVAAGIALYQIAVSRGC